MKADWYFDVISPFAYFQAERLTELDNKVELTLKPVLFAGLLNAYGQKGPAEIPSKRIFTYRMVTWQARDRGIPFRFPDAHPFNPIRALRLCIALGNEPDMVRKIFRAIWVDGHLPDNADGWGAIQRAVGVSDGDALVGDRLVKQRLIENGDAATKAGVFGVPTFIADGEIFWGDDAFEFFVSWLGDPTILSTPEMTKLTHLSASAERK